MNYIKVIEKKIKQYNKDLKLIIVLSEIVDKMQTTRIKIKFEDLVVKEIQELGASITEFKSFINEEKISQNKPKNEGVKNG